MKDEIKEILEDLEWRAKSHDIWYFMEQEKCKILYDYITNLQEENKDLKKGYCTVQVDLEDIEVLDKLKDYKSRNEKAIEYINKFWEKKSYYEDVDNCMKYATMNEWDKSDLLNILQGENKDE